MPITKGLWGAPNNWFHMCLEVLLWKTRWHDWQTMRKLTSGVHQSTQLIERTPMLPTPFPILGPCAFTPPPFNPRSVPFGKAPKEQKIAMQIRAIEHIELCQPNPKKEGGWVSSHREFQIPSPSIPASPWLGAKSDLRIDRHQSRWTNPAKNGRNPANPRCRSAWTLCSDHRCGFCPSAVSYPEALIQGAGISP